MGHAADFGDAVAEPSFVTCVVVTYQFALPVIQEGAGVFARSAGREVINSGFQVRERRGAVGPDVGLVGLFLARGQHADRSFIGMQDFVFQQSVSQRIYQRLQLHTAGTDPFGERGTWDFEASATEDAFLTVQW